MSRSELLRSLAALVAPPSPATAAIAAALELPVVPTAAQHTDVFALQLHPYASVHLGPEGHLGGIARDRVAGFFRALDVVPPAEPDHLAVLLDAAAQLLDLDDGPDSRARHARTVLLHEHLGSWALRFAARAQELGGPAYGPWASLLADVLRDEEAVLGPAPALPVHLADAPELPDPDEEGTDVFVAGLLAPVRSGLVLARADLARLAHERDLALRMGERAYMLRALLDQDPRAVLGGLATEAERQRAAVVGDGLVAGFWRGRLSATAARLEGLLTDRRPVRG